MSLSITKNANIGDFKISEIENEVLSLSNFAKADLKVIFFFFLFLFISF